MAVRMADCSIWAPASCSHPLGSLKIREIFPWVSPKALSIFVPSLSQGVGKGMELEHCSWMNGYWFFDHSAS